MRLSVRHKLLLLLVATLCAALFAVGGALAWLARSGALADLASAHGVVLKVLAASLLIAIPLAGWLGRRWINEPLEILRAGVHAYAGGKLDEPIILRSGDEFEALAEDFNLLAVALRVREIAIKEAEERWQFALDGAGHGVWDRNLKTGQVFFSKRWKAMLGYDEEEIGDRFEEWASRVHPDDMPAVEREMARHLAGKSDVYRSVHRLRAKDGSWHWILSQGRIVQREDDGQPLRMIGTHTDITEQRRTQERLEELMTALQESEAHYRSFFAEAKAAMLLVAPADGRIIDANPAASAFYGYSREELLSLSLRDISPLTREQMDAEMARSIREGREYFVLPHRRKDGSIRTVEVYSGPYHDRGRLILYSIIHDVTERVEAERAMREAATVFAVTSEAIVITDAKGVIKRVNPAFTAMTGYSAEEAIGQTPRILKSGRHDARFYAEMWSQLQSLGRWENEIWERRKNGEIFPVWQIISAVKDADGSTLEYVSLLIDITERKRSEAEIAYRANYDALTGLPNRVLLTERLGQAIRQARRENLKIAVMFIDLDLFKQVNDTLGHAVGDRLLQAVAERMRQCVRESDTIARLGGDEFVVLLSDINDANDAGFVAEKIIAQMSAPFVLDDNEIHIGASIGITLFPTDGQDVETLFRNADLAMYRAKAAGRNNAQFFEMAMTTAAIERRELEADLRATLAGRGFTLHYQPVIALQSRKIVGAEALLRWEHPQRGFVSPERFVPLAEETGLIRDIGAWVFGEACRQLAAWRDAGYDLMLALNVSVRQIPEPLSVANMLAQLGRHGLAPQQIILEITEGGLLSDSPAVRDWFMAASAAGFHAGHRRLRHRLLLAGLSEALSGASRQDRQGIRPRHGQRPGRPRSDRRDPGDDAQPGPVGRRRGCRTRGAGAAVGDRRLRVRPGLSVRPADDGSGIRHPAGAPPGTLGGPSCQRRLSGGARLDRGALEIRAAIEDRRQADRVAFALQPDFHDAMGLEGAWRQHRARRQAHRLDGRQQKTGPPGFLGRHHAGAAQRDGQRLARKEQDAGRQHFADDLRPAHRAEQQPAGAGGLHGDQLADAQSPAGLLERAGEPQPARGLIDQPPIFDDLPVFQLVAVIAAVVFLEAVGDAAEGRQLLALAAQFFGRRAARRLEGLTAGEVVMDRIDADDEAAGAAHRVSLVTAQHAAFDPARVDAPQHLAAGRLAAILAQAEPGRGVFRAALGEEPEARFETLAQFAGIEPARAGAGKGLEAGGLIAVEIDAQGQGR
ncbi:MAG: PAS domain S-box protein [Rhodocyclaceae bacterium]|nr:PAS domain S-box protein [Rhodocyclaceae bacterium]